MRKSFNIFAFILILTSLAWGDFLGIYNNGTDSADDSVWVYFSMWDSLALKFEAPDTLYICRFDPTGDTLSAETITSLPSLCYASGYYMKRYRAGATTGQYTVHAWGSGNGHYYSLANHNYFVSGDQQASIDSAGVYKAVLSALMADSASVDTGNGSFSHAAISRAALPDSLLGIVTKIDTMFASVGRPGVSSDKISLHMKLGVYDGNAGVGNIKDELDSLAAYVGKHNVTAEGIVSLHNKLGAYSGQAGPGQNVKDDINAIGGGGTEPETLFVFSIPDTSRLQGARVTVRTVDQSTVKIAGLTTDVNGRLILALDPAYYWIDVSANGHNAAFDTLIVNSGGGADSLFLAKFDPSNPAQPGLCRVYGWVYDIGGDSLEGIEVSAEIPREYHPVKYQNIVITPFSKSTETDSSGYWQIDLIPCSALSAEGVEYLFTINYQSGVVYRVRAVVPESPSWQLQ